MKKPQKRNDMSDMVHRIKTENAKGLPRATPQSHLGGYDEDGNPIVIETRTFGGNRGR